MHIFTLPEVVQIVLRLVENGMELKHAVGITTAAYGFDYDVVYRQFTKGE